MQTLSDKKRLYKLVAYLVMFDGGVYYPSRSAPHCAFIMNHTSRQFIDHAASILSQITRTRITERKDYNTDGCSRKPQWRLETAPHPVFTRFRERLYFQGYKSVDSHWLSSLDGESLALMYMADGSMKMYGKGYRDIYLNTKRLTEGDNKLITHYLRKNLGIEATLNRQNQYNYIRVSVKSHARFLEAVAPYMLEDFRYKLSQDPAFDVPRSIPGGDIVCTAQQ